MATAETGLTPVDTGLTPAQVDLIRDTVAKGATDDELRMFLYQCQRLQLDPMLRQVHWVKRPQEVDGQWKSVGTMIIGIDGMRLAARRTGELRGLHGPQWCGPDGQWADAWLADDPPAAARVGVERAGLTGPVWAVARYATYCQLRRDGTPNRTWAKMPDLMLAKAAEAMALRRAFPDALSGVHVDEELPVPLAATTPEASDGSAPASLADRARAAAEALEAPPDSLAPDAGPADNGPTLSELRAQLEAHGATAADLRRWIAEAVGDKPSGGWTDADRAAVRRRLAEALAGGDA